MGGLKNSEMLTDTYAGAKGWVGLKQILISALSDYQVCAPSYTKVGQMKSFFMIAEMTY